MSILGRMVSVGEEAVVTAESRSESASIQIEDR